MKTMCISKRIISLLIAFIISISLIAQKRSSITVLNIDTHGLNFTPDQLGNLVRLELERLDNYEVMDRYDVAYLIKKNNLDVTNCYGKIGLVETGTTLKSDKMLSGSIELYGQTIILTFRLVDVANAVIEKSYVREYLNLPTEMQSIIKVSLREMFGQQNDPALITQLTKQSTFDTKINTPETDRLNLAGPRIGFTVFTGPYSNILRKSNKDDGGFNLTPVMFQFGYQFEKMYLNEGNFQALFEFIPMITGVDQQIIIPSVTIMNGLRHNLYGWEVAVGPNFGFSKKAEVEIGGNTLKKDWKETTYPQMKFETRADSRGDYKFSTSLVIAAGKTFKSGKMNFPVNFYFIPGKDGQQFGISLGYNAKRTSK